MSLGRKVVLAETAVCKVGELSTVYVSKEGALYYAEIRTDCGVEGEEVIMCTTWHSDLRESANEATNWAKQNPWFVR